MDGREEIAMAKELRYTPPILAAFVFHAGRKVMRRLIILSVLLFHLPIWAQTTIPETYVNHA